MFTAYYKVRRDLSDTGRVDGWVELSSRIKKYYKNSWCLSAVSSECLKLRRLRQYIEPSGHWECIITNVNGGRRNFWKGMLFCFTTSRGARFFFQPWELFFCFLWNAGFFFRTFWFCTIFFPVYGLPPAPPHNANGAFLTSCSVQCITPRVCGGDITQSGCDHTTCTMVGQEPIWAPGWGYSKGTLSVQSLS